MSHYSGNNIGVCLRYALAMRNLTEKQFAEMAHTSHSAILRYADGTTCPTDTTLRHLASTLGLEPYHLLGSPNPNDRTDSIGFRMRTARLNAGMTVPELAAKTDVTEYEIGRCESNHELLGYIHFTQIADALGVTVPHLLFNQ